MAKIFRFVGINILIILLYSLLCHTLDDGSALTPPMGWLSWTRFMCQTDCVTYPKQCISENLFESMAEILVKEGYRDVGYNRINIDDCWMSKNRNAQGNLEADNIRFPKGIAALADKMHSMGLLLGIYTNMGTTTCMRFPGSLKHLKEDAKIFSLWKVDMLKMDGCFTDPSLFEKGYTDMGKYLNATGRKIIYTCSWPYYDITVAQKEPNYNLIKRTCHMWRNFDDIQISYTSIKQIINFYDIHQDKLSKFHGPGSWNDPDMLIIGNPGLSLVQAKVQMAIWCIWSAPLLMSNDLREIDPEFKAILQNPRLIAIDQDPLGKMGKLFLKVGYIKVYVKRVTPVIAATDLYSFAIAFHNIDEQHKGDIRISLQKLELMHSSYDVQELFEGRHLGRYGSESKKYFNFSIQPSDVIVIKATAICEGDSCYIDTNQTLPLNLLFVIFLTLFCLVIMFMFCKVRYRYRLWNKFVSKIVSFIK